MPTVEDLVAGAKQCIVVRTKISELIKQNKEFGSTLPIRDFVLLMQMLTPQAYGARIQNRLISEIGFKKVKQSDDEGDCEDVFGDRWEIKASIVTNTNNFLNLVQIRPWQNIKGYLCVVFDTRVDPMAIMVYRLFKNNMQEECIFCKAASAHGVRAVLAENNKNIELRFGIKIDESDSDFIRWNNKYLTKFNFSDI